MLKSMTTNWMMSLMICCCLAVTAGCDPVNDKEYLDLTEKTQLGAYISLAVVTSTPDPDGGGGKLEIGDSCPDCGGRGMVGDGTIENKCNRCNGTGKIQKGDPDVAAMSEDNGITWMTNKEVEDWQNETWVDELARADLPPQLIADIRSAIKRWLENTADSIQSDRSCSAEPPMFAPTQEDREGGNVLPQSPNPGSTPEMHEDEMIRSPDAPSQKRCLCGPECGCGGDCDPCNCIYCGLPESGPGLLLSEQPLIATYVFKDGAIYVKDGEELKPLE